MVASVAAAVQCGSSGAGVQPQRGHGGGGGGGQRRDGVRVAVAFLRDTSPWRLTPTHPGRMCCWDWLPEMCCPTRSCTAPPSATPQLPALHAFFAAQIHAQEFSAGSWGRRVGRCMTRERRATAPGAHAPMILVLIKSASMLFLGPAAVSMLFFGANRVCVHAATTQGVPKAWVTTASACACRACKLRACVREGFGTCACQPRLRL